MAQSWFVRSRVGRLARGEKSLTGAARYLEIAERIGRRLVRDAYWHEGRATWFGWTSEAVGESVQAVFRALGPSLYEGVAGIAVFLARLGMITGDRVFRHVANGAVSQIIEMRRGSEGPGAYLGAAGLGFALAASGAAIEREDAVRHGLQLLAESPLAASGQDVPDVLAGEAGRIQSILAASSLGRTAELLATAAAAGEKLLGLARVTEHGLGWDVPGIASAVPLGGYAHGASGIACALAGLGAALGDLRFTGAARCAVAYERSLFDAKEQNWPDLRPVAVDDESERTRFAVTWCNGACGIGLARLYLSSVAPDEAYLAEIETAWNAARRSLTEIEKPNYCLCHGFCGNVEFLADAGRALARPDWLLAAAEFAEEAATRVSDAGESWRSGVISRAETATLMLGLAGIGHFYLRLAEPERVPSLLVIHAKSITP